MAEYEYETPTGKVGSTAPLTPAQVAATQAFFDHWAQLQTHFEPVVEYLRGHGYPHTEVMHTGGNIYAIAVELDERREILITTDDGGLPDDVDLDTALWDVGLYTDGDDGVYTTTTTWRALDVACALLIDMEEHGE